MHILVFLALFLSLIGCSRGATYCECKSGLSDAVLQKTIDYACGAGADCHPILQNGVCFQPNTVKAHCDYAANSYFQNKGQATGSCDFTGTATTSTSLSSTLAGGCTYPTSPGQGGTYSGTGISGTTTTGTPGSTTGIYGGSTGLGPTGFGDSNPNGGSPLFHFFPLVQAFLFLGLLVMWG